MVNHRIEFAAAGLAYLAAWSSSAELQLAQDGATSYSIVRPAESTKLDEYAINALTGFLLVSQRSRLSETWRWSRLPANAGSRSPIECRSTSGCSISSYRAG